MPFRVLGTIQAENADGLIQIPPGRQQTTLAVLLLGLNRVVSTDRLVDVLWRDDPPETARTQVQICVSRLRRLIRGVDARIHTRQPGYMLEASPTDVDAQLHRLWAEEAGSLVHEGRDAEAAQLLRSAVNLWRGPALSGSDNEILRSEAFRLEEERLDATDAYLDIELRLGRHAHLVSEITALVEAHPLREELRAKLMLALYRTGRQAEALEVYRNGRARLIEELGLEPGNRLRELERAILEGAPSLDPEPPVTGATTASPEPSGSSTGVPEGATETAKADRQAQPEVTAYQLPKAAADFVGRDEVVDAMKSSLNGQSGAAGVALLTGRPGVGKSATALHVAHELAEHSYPDGQLYCDMRGSRRPHADPADVLSRFLRALGVPGQAIPEDMDERASTYRGVLASKRVLIVLDDAASEGQVEPLLPGNTNCGVIVSSRTRLTGLPGVVPIELDVLSADTSLKLLNQVLGPERVEAEPEAARALIRTVGQLPLALRVVAARLAARRYWPLAGMVERLADERHRLDELAHGDMTVRASLSLTHDGLPEPAPRVFALLGVTEAPTIPAWVPGAMLDDHRSFPSELAEPLVDAHMLDVVGIDNAGEPVYRFHDLVRDFAREQFDHRSALSRQAVIERVLGGWLTLLDEANRRMVGGDYLQVRGGAPRRGVAPHYIERALADPYSWLENERSNLRHAVEQAVNESLLDHAWELAVGTSVFLDRRGYVDDIALLYDLVKPCLVASGNRLGDAALTEGLGALLRNRYDEPTRRALLERTLTEFVELGEIRGEALVRTHLAFMDHNAGDDRSAITGCERGLQGFAEVMDIGGRRRCLMLLGYLRVRNGAVDQGGRDLEEARELAELAGDTRALAQVLDFTARADLFQHDYDSARDRLQTALRLTRELDDPLGEGKLLGDLSHVHLTLCQVDTARSNLVEARELWRRLRQEQRVAEVERKIADISVAVAQEEADQRG